MAAPHAPTGSSADIARIPLLLAGRPQVEVTSLGEDALTARRHDAKAVLPLAAIDTLLAAVPAGWQVVTAGGLTAVPYDTVYFDSPDLRLFRDHRQGRLRRAKVRTRRYSDGTTFLEVKLKGPAGLTEKVRRPHHDHGQLALSDLTFIEDTIRERIGPRHPEALAPTVWTRYVRTVLRAPDGSERLTLDTALATGRPSDPGSGDRHAAGQAGTEVAGPVIVELKSHAPRSTLLPALHRAGARPVRLSKYAVAITTAHDLHATRWRPALRQLEARR